MEESQQKIALPIVVQYYTWEDDIYENFMSNVLTKLEPRIEYKDTILFEELDEVNEVLFISKGIVDVGFKVNNFPKFVI